LVNGRKTTPRIFWGGNWRHSHPQKLKPETFTRTLIVPTIILYIPTLLFLYLLAPRYRGRINPNWDFCEWMHSDSESLNILSSIVWVVI
jgi:hypothetical protein